ncbi:carbonic anhydrase-like [Saccostrea echinata]|uniref:carbonic anhydrase-like n=1 Tax=Saccostrea echinata TaxID=191078 RepID=UPI002A8036BA|nr:carbonic anhydrase-like [Saccostrea echinata]
MYRIFTMAVILQVIIFCFSCSVFASASEVAWTYGETNGPTQWRNSYPICGLTSQSPINLPDTEDMIFDPSLKPFQFSGFINPQDYKLKVLNNGHTVKVSVEEGNLMVEGGGLPGRYKTAQFHFHWGRDNTQGSEHLYSGTRYPMELHVVNYNEKYGNLSNAASQAGDGLAVLGFFFVPNGNTDNSALTTLLNKFNDVKTKGSMTELTGFNIGFMLPLSSGNADRFYRYSGSLTTPPCFESVVWTIFENTIPISDSQLGMFRMLQEDDTPNSDHVIVDNFRPVQALNGRQVRKSFASSASGLQISFLALFLVLSRLL